MASTNLGKDAEASCVGRGTRVIFSELLLEVEAVAGIVSFFACCYASERQGWPVRAVLADSVDEDLERLVTEGTRQCA